ncbi:MAG: WD40 repeat domain-containing protein [Cyanobacteria bacterium J06632_22]
MFRQLTGSALLAVLMLGHATSVSAQFEPVAGISRACWSVWSDPLQIPPAPQPDEGPLVTLSGGSRNAQPDLPRRSVDRSGVSASSYPPRFEDPTVLPWQRLPMTAVAYSPDDRYIVTGSAYGLVQLWTADAEPIGFPFGVGEAAHIELVGFSADGERILVGDRRGWLRQWDLSGRLLSEVDTQEHDYAAVAWDLSPDSTQVVVGSLRGDLQLWDVSESRSRLMARTDLEESPYAIAFSPMGHGLAEDMAVGMRQGEVRFFNKQLQPSRPDLNIVADTVTGLSWYPNTRILAIRDRQGIIRVVDATDQPFIPALTDLSGYTNRAPLGYSPSGQLVSVASLLDWRQRPTLVSWNLQQQATNVPVDRGDPTAFAFNREGHVAVGNGDCTLRLWDRDLEPVLLPFSRPQDEVATVA